jgi:Na+-translocating ferredoxin:NAD+ oxidoreductase RnfE subunit
VSTLIIVLTVSVLTFIAFHCDAALNLMGKNTPPQFRYPYLFLIAASLLNCWDLLTTWKIELHFFVVFIPLIIVLFIERRKDFHIRKRYPDNG